MSYLSVSTWSLHRLLGPLRWTYWDEVEMRHGVQVDPQPETMTLLELPGVLAAKGYKAVDICHFHFPDVNPDYLNRLKQACSDANIVFYTLLLDYGDISSENKTRADADVDLIRNWIDIAAEAGAERLRVVAGEASPDDPEALSRCVQHLRNLSGYAKQRGVRIVSENFKSLASTSANCMEIIRQGQGDIGMIADFGNFEKAFKIAELSALLPLCESVHAKPEYDDQGVLEEEQFRRLLGLLREANYDGPLTIIYDGPGDMWQGVERVRKIAEDYL